MQTSDQAKLQRTSASMASTASNQRTGIALYQRHSREFKNVINSLYDHRESTVGECSGNRLPLHRGQRSYLSVPPGQKLLHLELWRRVWALAWLVCHVKFAKSCARKLLRKRSLWGWGRGYDLNSHQEQIPEATHQTEFILEITSQQITDTKGP